MSQIYLDYNATTPLKPAARNAMLAALDAGNASSIHGAGRAARRLTEDARIVLAENVNVKPAQIIFTSGASEANALALLNASGPVIISAIEHESVLTAPDATRIGVDSAGVIDLAHLQTVLAATVSPAFVSIMLVNNETGVIQPIAEIAKLTRTYNVRLHCDAVQGLARVPIDMPALGVDMLSVSAHKMGGPKGAGALIIKDGLPITPLIKGGGQEMRRRAGTENVAAIAGFGAAVADMENALVDQARLNALRDQLEHDLAAAVPQLQFFGQGAPRVAGVSMFALPGMTASTQLMKLDIAGFCVSTGSACSSGKVTPSHVLQAMGADDAMASCAIRVSFGWATTAAEIEKFIAAYGQMARGI